MSQNPGEFKCELRGESESFIIYTVPSVSNELANLSMMRRTTSGTRFEI